VVAVVSQKLQKRKNSPLHLRKNSNVLSDPIGTPSPSHAGNDNRPNHDDPQLGAWIPVGSASSLKGLTPVQIEIMGTNYVVWDSPKNDDNDDTNNNSNWSVMVDVCPHRLVPLSQGRINPDSGCIECAYYGWQFATNGTLTCLQQLDPNASSSSSSSSFESIQRTASASSVSVHLTGDLIWAFLPTSVHGESFPKSLLPEEHYYPGLVEDTSRGATYYVHELPCNFDMTVENGLDPSHFPFARHGIISRRSDAAPMPMMKAVTSNFTHLDIFAPYKKSGQSRDRLYSFQRLSLLYTQEKAKDSSYSSSWKQSSKFLSSPSGKVNLD
jgi:phenylpropionate dioxygenase-like ring-hydroxylating dioxygenase large terminal subunit